MSECVSHERECALIMVQYIYYLFFLSTVKAHTDIRKMVLSRVIIFRAYYDPGRQSMLNFYPRS